MKKFGILYICTGKYDVFWQEFYESCEKYLLNNDFEKYYFVWTDSDRIIGNKNVKVFKITDLGWPQMALKRYDFFLSKEEILKEMDYLYFFNSNLEIKDTIGKEILPRNINQVVVGSIGGWYFLNENKKFPYDRNPLSKAYIKKGEGNMYVQSGLTGGTNKSFLEMSKVLYQNLKIDDEKGIIALWHDESHLNRYIYDLEMSGQKEKFFVLPPSYLYPEGAHFSFPCKILIRDKSRYFNVWKVKKTRAGFIDFCVFTAKKILKKLKLR